MIIPGPKVIAVIAVTAVTVPGGRPAPTSRGAGETLSQTPGLSALGAGERRAGPSSDALSPNRAVVAAETTRQVLEALARAIPEKGEDLVTRVEIRSGWAGAVHVRVHSLLPRAAGEELADRVRRSIADAVPSRHTVEIVWASAG